MEKNLNAPRSLILSTRLYQRLLAVYPSEFRKEYGSPMLQVFRDCTLRTLNQSGAAGLLALWWRTVLDTVRTAIEEHSQRGVDMSKETFIKLSGWALILGPILFMIGLWAESRPPFIPNTASSLPIDRYANTAGTPLAVFGLVFMSLGFLGMMLRYSPKWNSASILLGIGSLAGIAGAVGVVGLAVDDGWPWDVFILGIGVQFIALAVFGLINLRLRLLPRWNALPILAFWFPVMLVVSSGIFSWEISKQIFISLWILTCVMFAILGYQLQSDHQPSKTAVYLS